MNVSGLDKSLRITPSKAGQWTKNGLKRHVETVVELYQNKKITCINSIFVREI